MYQVSDECRCWVGHGDCGGCSGYPGIAHEPACGFDWNPDCPEHGRDKLPSFDEIARRIGLT
jgi:hypothetical protein